jgi:hypothetical protein
MLVDKLKYGEPLLCFFSSKTRYRGKQDYGLNKWTYKMFPAERFLVVGEKYYFDIWENSIVQNIFHFKKLAPKVHDIVKVNYGDTYTFYAQITDFLSGELGVSHELHDRIVDISNELGITYKDLNSTNFIDGKCIDFEGWLLPDHKKYAISEAKSNGLDSLDYEELTKPNEK